MILCDKDFLIQEYWRFVKENKKHPTMREMKVKNGFPNYKTYISNWGSWNEFLINIGVKKELNKSEDFLIKELKRYVELYDRIPLSEEFKKDKNFPGLHFYKEVFGTWNNALLKAGFKINRVKKLSEETIKSIVSDYLNGMSPDDIAKKFNYSDSASIYYVLRLRNINKRTNRWSENQLSLLKEKYSYEDWDVLLEILYPFSKEDISHKAYKLGIKREEHFWSEQELEILHNNYGKTRIDKLQKLLPERNYDAICTKASRLGLKTREFWTEEEINQFKEMYPITDNKELIKIFNRNSSAILSLAYNLDLKKDSILRHQYKEERKSYLLIKLQEFADELGRTPTQIEITDNKNMPGMVDYFRYFRTYSNACKLLGLDINLVHFGNGNVSYLSKNNDICQSKAELIITDYLIDNNISYEKGVLYKDILNDITCGYSRCDWFINNKIIVEYFGLYNPKLKNENTLIQSYNLKTEEKIAKYSNLKDFIFISLFPQDMKKDLNGVKRKLYKHLKISA